jgi:hypothetical protein
MTISEINDINKNEKVESDIIDEKNDVTHDAEKNANGNNSSKTMKDPSLKMKKFHIGQEGDIADDGSIQIKNNSGNINIYYSDDNKKKKYVTHDLNDNLSLLRSIFVESRNYLKFKDEMKNNNLIIIHGNENTGRFSTGLNFITEKNLKMYWEIITDGCKLETIRDIRFEGNNGYILRNISDSNIKILESNRLFKLNEALKKVKSYLVIIIDECTYSLIKRDAFNFSFDWTSDYRKEDIIYNHILHFYKNEHSEEVKVNDIKIKKIINKPKIKEMINLLNISDIPEFTYNIAKQLSGNLTENEISQKIAENIDSEIEKFIEDSDSCSEQLFILTLAMLEGIGYRQIIKGYKLLKVKLEKHLSLEDLDEINQKKYLMIKRSDRLKKVRAYITYGIQQKKYGSEKVELVEFNNKRYSNIIIRYFWREFDSWRIDITEWLLEVGKNSNYFSKRRIIKKLGYICTFDFNLVIDKMQKEWVVNGRRNKIATAKVLNHASLDDKVMLMKQLNLIQHWATLKNNKDLNEVALYCYAILFERISIFDNDLKNIKGIIQKSDLIENDQLRYAIYFCFRNMFKYKLNDKDDCKKVINFILILINTSDKYTRRFIKLLFLSISDELYVQVEKNLIYPIFLWIFREKKYMKTKIIELWLTCLNDTKIRKLSMESLQYLFKKSDENTHLYMDLEKFMIVLICEGTNNNLNIVVKHLDNWVKKKLDGFKSATRFLRCLRKRLNPILISQKQIEG